MGAGHAHALYVHGHSRVHRLPPEAKLVAVVGFVFGVALTPREAVWAFAVDAVALAGVVALARLPLRFVAARLMVVAPFVTFALLIPVVASGEQVEVLGVGLSREGLWGAWNVLAKATLGATASILLAGTTEIPVLLTGMGRLRVPQPLTLIATFMVRYLELVADDLRRMRTAMTARGYDPRWLWQTKPITSSAGALFIRSYERSERVHAAMLSRGFTGTMPVLEARRPRPADWAAAAALPLVAVAAAILAVLSSGTA